MVITEEVYVKEFESDIGQEDISYHGSPTYEYFQTNSKEDLELREKIIQKFALKTDYNSHGNGKYQGFDGTFLYLFNFSGTPKGFRKSKKEEVQPLKYKAEIAIKKSGNNHHYEISDLEGFLISEGFKIIP
ncbi:Uncharacterised protein [uncultured archaeon]|nr:Uncharacterised protein [uncultured archaeon]